MINNMADEDGERDLLRRSTFTCPREDSAAGRADKEGCAVFNVINRPPYWSPAGAQIQLMQDTTDGRERGIYLRYKVLAVRHEYQRRLIPSRREVLRCKKGE